MAKNNGKFRVPKSEEKEFVNMIKRANRRWLANEKWANDNLENTDKTGNSLRSLLGIYADKSTWKTNSAPFSKSLYFESEKEYQQTKRYAGLWGEGEKGKYVKSPEVLKKGYVDAIVRALTVPATDSGFPVMTKAGKLPGNIRKKLEALSFEQLENWFDVGDDPAEEAEKNGWHSNHYYGVDRETFVELTESHLYKLKELFPSKNDRFDKTGKPILTPPPKISKKNNKRKNKRKNKWKNKRKKKRDKIKPNLKSQVIGDEL